MANFGGSAFIDAAITVWIVAAALRTLLRGRGPWIPRTSRRMTSKDEGSSRRGAGAGRWDARRDVRAGGSGARRRY